MNITRDYIRIAAATYGGLVELAERILWRLPNACGNIVSYTPEGAAVAGAAMMVCTSRGLEMYQLGTTSWSEAYWVDGAGMVCLLYTSPSPRDVEESRMPSSA